MRSVWFCVLFLAIGAGCQKNPPRVDLGVDVYLHPEAAGTNDVILQAAIRGKLAEAFPSAADLVHVTVLHKVVFLKGTASSEQNRQKAIDIARNIDVRVDGAPIKPAEINSEALQVQR